MGPNGAGKTTLILALIGEMRHDGDIDVMTGRSGKPLRLGYVPQRISIDRGMPLTVVEFLVMGIQKRPLWLGIRPSLKAHSLELLSMVKAEHLASRRLGDLSGGEMQRVLLALALQQEPELLVLDEPSAGVDFQGEHLFCELLDELRAAKGFTQLMVSHDLGMVFHHATHVICLKRHVFAEGTPDEVLTQENLMALFGMHMASSIPMPPPRTSQRTTMLDLEPLYHLVSLLPFECLQAGFMQQALVALILLAPMAATMGVQVVSFRMAFFSDAISHSAFAGVALGLIFSINPHVAMPVFGILVGLGIMAVQRNSALSSDTIIGVFFSAVMAFGLAVVSRDNAVARDLQQFLYGDILTITETDIRWLIGLFFALAAFQIWGYNRLLYIGLNSVVAKAHRINVFFWQYLFAGLLALVVMFSVWAVGVLLVTALLIVPAATARNLARTAGGMFWWSILVSVTSAVAGLVLSAQEWAGTATGATVVLVSCGWFLLSAVLAAIRGEGRRQ